MIRTATIAFFALFFTSTAFAQVKGGADDFNKLFDMYVMEQYEDCAYKAFAMSEKEKYTKSPEPYLYLSMCYLRISENEELEEEYPKARTDAFKMAAKFRKKDKSGELFEQNVEFFDELKEKGCADAKWWIGEDNVKKAASAYKLVWKVDKADYNIEFMAGACYAMAKYLGDAKIMLSESVTGLNANYADPGYEPNKVTEPVLVDAMIMYSDWLVQNSQADSAKSMVGRAVGWMPENDDLKKQLEKLEAGG